MLFSSMTFLFVFLPTVCGAYFCVRKEARNMVLLLASVIFYAWGEPRYLAVMLTTVLVNYFGALAISRSKMRGGGIFLCLTLAVDFGFLIYFKYTNFLLDNLRAVFDMHADPIAVVMPIGISFYTFQAISYVVDVYRREIPVQKDIYKLALFISLFPQLVAGPIVKYRDIAQQIDDRDETFEKVAAGLKRFIMGLAKKVLIANTMGAVADKIFTRSAGQIDPIVSWLGAVAYTFQIYFDFSGYSDMAIGLGTVFGFTIPENFNYPYISKSITEFWRRWHISLSTWFKEYLYIPLGGNRVSKIRMYLNLLIVFLATGVWHGASWNFVIWGLWHGFFIVGEKMTGAHLEKKSAVLRGVQHVYTLFVVVIGWVLFRADTLTQAGAYLKNMFCIGQTGTAVFDVSYYVDTVEILAFAAAIVLSAPFMREKMRSGASRPIFSAAQNVYLLALFVLSAGALASSTYNPFIYFRF